MCANSVKNGRFKFDISYRNFAGDEGLSIQVRGHVNEVDRELLRFDCFLKTPHYHTAVYDHNTIRAIESQDAAAWSLDRLTNDFEELIGAAGGDPVNRVESEAHRTAMAEVRSKSEHLIAESVQPS